MNTASTGERKPPVRERAELLRQQPQGAVRASPATPWLGSILLSCAVAAFLSFVGAWGTSGFPALQRMLFFISCGLATGLAVALCVVGTARIPALAGRPWLRRASIGMIMWPVSSLIVWAAVGLTFTHGPRLKDLPIYLAPSFLMAVAMTLLSWAVFRARTATAAPPAAEPPRFLERLPVRLRDAEIYAVQAEDHYLRVHTSKGSDLILMRLTDAVVELDGIEGAQTHRSWWVARAALADARRGDGRAVLKLKDGTEAPVSRTYARELRDAGWF